MHNPSGAVNSYLFFYRKQTRARRSEILKGYGLDATLVDFDGRELPMPTYFDEDLEKAASTTRPNDPEVQRNLDLLHHAMRAAGLKPLNAEWWHFDDEDFLLNPVPVITAASLGMVIE